MKKRLLSALMAASMVVTTAPAAFAVEGEQPATPETSTEQTTTPGESTVVTPEAEAPQDTQPEAVTKAVAQIGETKYGTLGEAIKAVGDGETIKLNCDVPDAEGISVAEGKNFTVDFGGFTYTLAGPGAGSLNTETNGFQLLKDSTITFKNGTINVVENASAKNVKRIIQNYANLTLEDMTFETKNLGANEDYALSFNNGNIVFKGNTSIKMSSPEKSAFDICKFSSYPSVSVAFDDTYTGTIGGKIVYDSANAETHKLKIEGNGTFEGAIELSTASTNGANITISGGTFSNPESVKEYLDDSCTMDENGNVVALEAANAVAQAGDKYYKTFEAAIKAVDEGQKVVLLKDTVLDNRLTVNNGKKFTIDLGGKNLTLKNRLSIESAFVTVENGTIIGDIMLTASSEDKAYNSFTLAENAKIDGSYGIMVFQKEYGANNFGTTVNVKGEITGTASALWVLGNITTDYAIAKNPVVVNVGSKAAMKNTSDGTGLQMAGACVVTVEDGATITGNTAIEVRAGKLIVNGGTITGAGIPTEVKPNGNGTSTVGVGIAVAQHTTKQPIEVVVNGGKISGYTGLLVTNPQNNDGTGAVKATINGGTFEAISGGKNAVSKDDDADVMGLTIAGGNFKQFENLESYLEPGCALDKNGTVVPEENSVAKIGNKGYKTLADALGAVKETGGTITLLKDATLENAQYFINKSVTVNGSGKISCTVAAGETTRAFVVEENGSLTLDGVELDIKGTKNPDTAKKNDGTGIDVQHGGSLILKNKAVLNLHDLERATISSKPEASKTEHPGQFIIDNSTFISTNIDGNASNGGDWKVINESTVNIDNCGAYGLSVDTMMTEKSTVNISKTGYSAIYGKELQFKDGSNVAIGEAGTKLPFQSKYSDVKSPIQVNEKTGGSLIVDQGATVTVQNCVDKDQKSNNTVYLPSNGTYTNNGTVNAEIVTAEAPEGSFVVTLVSDGKTVGTATVQENEKFTLPEAPKKSNYVLTGWYDGVKIYKVGDEVAITGEVTFTAQWKYNGSSSGGGSSSFSNRTLTFNVNGGSELKKLTKAKGATIDLSDYTPTRAGYTFAGWYSDKELTAKITSVKLNDNTTVYAKWTKNANENIAGFEDVDSNDWFAEEVQYVVDKGLMSGTSKTTFAPSATTTRGMIVAILHRLEKEPVATASAFTDVKAGAYYEKAINWASENEIVMGMSETIFAPDQAITREQMAAILYRYAQFKGYDMSKANKLDAYADAAQVSAYAVPAMQWANAENLITGKSATVLDPKGNATRAEVSSILMRFCENIAK